MPVVRGRPLKIHAGALADIPVLDESAKLDRLAQAFFDALLVPDYIGLADWSDAYRVLPRESSSEFGRWRTSRFPFLRRIMDCMSPASRAKVIVVMKGAQLGFTEIIINWMMYVADFFPCPFMYIQATLDAVKIFNTMKLGPSIRVTERVRDTLGSGKDADLSDSALRKAFPGGGISMGGANSDKFLRSQSAQYIGVDEEDTFRASVGNVGREQGSPVAMVRKRQANFPLAKMLRISTPVIKETSTIEPGYLDGSQEQYYVPCPICNPSASRHGAMFVLRWEHIRYSKELDSATGLPIDVYCECPFCSARIQEYKKTWMLENGLWLSNKGREDGELYEVGDVEYPSFQISSFYSPLGFFSWFDAVKEWFDYLRSRDPSLLQVIVNQTWGETYSVAGHDISSNWVASRVEHYHKEDTGEVLDVPAGGLVVTAGVDVQADRLEVEVVAWGLYDESWSVDYAVLWGNTEFLGDRQGLDPNTGMPTVWAQLSAYLNQRWLHASGAYMPVECTLIDSKYKSEQVHAFCRMHESRRIYPAKGIPGWGKAKGHISRPRRRTERFGTWQFSLYPDELKDTVYQALSLSEPGPGYCHFPDKSIYDHKYFRGLTAENKKTKMVSGRTVMYWDCPSGARNEPLDCRCLAYAAKAVYAPNLELRSQLDNPLEALNQMGGSGSKRRKVSGGIE